MEEVIKLVRTIIPDFGEDAMDVDFAEAGIDSMDLVTVRVLFEKKFGQVIPDAQWLTFKTLNDIAGFYDSNATPDSSEEEKLASDQFHKNIVVNMPQMAVEALSENWLFKEMGGIHWDLLCEGLARKSFDLADDLGNRLYATFIRIRFSGTGSLFDFKENENLSVSGKIKRFGNSMYHSFINFSGEHESLEAELLTSFSVRNDSDNSKLVKSQPAPGVNTIQEYEVVPDFANDYRRMKKRELQEISIQGMTFSVTEEAIFETEYTLNPYYELNGVGLLYFAAYTIINDTCAAKYFNEGVTGYDRWEQSYYTVMKDIFYYANCNIDETIVFRLHEVEELGEGRLKLSSTLYRKSDGAILAKVFCIKQKVTRG